MPDLPLPILLEEIDHVGAPHPVRPDTLAIDALALRLTVVHQSASTRKAE